MAEAACILLTLSLATRSYATDADGGLARAYFSNLKLHAAKVTVEKRRRDNIIWIVSDAVRPDHLGLYGYDKPTSPFLDKLSRDALVFVNNHSNAPWTRPATTSMLTGLYPSWHRNQTDESRLTADIPTVAERLQHMGYRTAAFVGNGNASRVAGLHKGFDHYVDTVVRWDGLPSAAEVLGEAADWVVAQSKRSQPWFVFIFLVDSHDPYHAPADYEKRWLKGMKGKPRRTAHWEYKNHYPQAQRRSMMALYDASIRYTDDQLRAFWSRIEGDKLASSTAFIFTSDHGEAFGEHGYYLHSYHHLDEFIRTPLIIKSPSIHGSGHVLALSMAVDLTPTVVALAGGAIRDEIHGQSLLELVQKPVDRHRMGVSEYNNFGIRRAAIFDLTTKVIVQMPADRDAFLQKIPKPELLPSVRFDREVVKIYDRIRDPHERHPMSPKQANPAQRELVSTLRDYMKKGPSPNRDVDLSQVPQSVIDDLRSLGYVQ